MKLHTYRNIYSTNNSFILTNIVVSNKKLRTTLVALWDTGASVTHISEDVIDALGLETVGERTVQSHTGMSTVKKYKADITLPMNCTFEDIIVHSGADLTVNGEQVQAIIGMDIIKCGIFHVDYTGDRTVFTFSLPTDRDEEYEVTTELF